MNSDIAAVVTDSIATRIAGGTSEMQKVNIFNQLAKLTPSSASFTGQRQ